ncbi:hypothetical protein [Streptomyces sp. NPDC040750]|uniref:hypothetical protein n=1 Tax=Streptomyces sp. NPDC040750 TaxID=3154491 RepID=UPI0033F67251
MTFPVRVVLPSLIVLLGLTSSCTPSPDKARPAVICGTPVEPGLTRHLVPAGGDYREFNRVDRTKAVSAPCVLLAGKDAVLDFHFWWTDGPTDFKYMTAETGSVSRVNNARKIEFRYPAVAGTDGAIATAPCKTRRGNYFTLTLQLPLIKVTDRSRRGDIERFMRVYFPATVATLGCS